MSTQVIQKVNLNLGGCLPIGSEITDVRVECAPVDEKGDPIVDDNGKAIPQIIIEQTNERGEVTTFIVDLCPDNFMSVTDNGDGTITATNIDGVEVTWHKESTIAEDNEDGTATITMPDGSTVDVTTIGFVVEGEGIGVTGEGSSTDPYVINTALCGLKQFSQSDLSGASTILQAGCIDGEQGLFPPQGITELPEQPCIPRTEGEPQTTPTGSESKVMIDCDDSLWVFTCANGWQKISFGVPDLQQLNPEQVSNICEALKFSTWYENEEGCIQQKEIDLQTLSDVITQCLCGSLPDSSNPSDAKVLICSPNDQGVTVTPVPDLICSNVVQDQNNQATHAFACTSDGQGGTIIVERPISSATLEIFDRPISAIEYVWSVVNGNNDFSGVLNTNTIPGVTIPVGAKGIIVRSFIEQNGGTSNFTFPLPDPADEAAIFLGAATAYIGTELNTEQASVYTDSQAQQIDDNNTNDVFVKTNGALLPFKFSFRSPAGSGGIDEVYYRLAILGYYT